MEKTNQEKTQNRSFRRLGEILATVARHHVARGMTPVKMREILEDLGPTFVKFGQIMSMRSDMIPLEYCKELESLRTNVFPLDFSEILPVIEEELGCPAEKVFATIDPSPLGSASVAQVHKAVLKNGTEVVLKVQRPHIYQIMYEDLHLLHSNAFLIRKILHLGNVIDFKKMVEELWKTSEAEMDFTGEAANIERYRKNNAEIVYVTCPVVYQAYTTKRLLTMSQIHGIQIDHISGLEAAGYDLSEIAEKTAENFCKQVLDDGFFQADPHPGNLIISGGKIGWIDWGMTGTVSPHLRQILITAIRAIWENDVYALENALLMIGEPRKPINQARIITQLNYIMQEYRSADFGHFDMGNLFNKLIDLVTQNEIIIPPDLTTLARSIVTAEGTVSKIDPDVSLMQIFSVHLRTELLNNFDPKKKAEKKAYGLYKSIMKSLEIPSDTSDILNLTKTGRLTVNIIENTSPDTLRARRGNMRRIVYAIMMFTFYLCGSILCLSDRKPLIFGIPYLAAIGMILGTVMLVILIISIVRWRKQ